MDLEKNENTLIILKKINECESIEKYLMPFVEKALKKYSNPSYTKEILKQKQETLRTLYATKENVITNLLMYILLFVSIIFSVANYFEASSWFYVLTLLGLTLFGIFLIVYRTYTLRQRNDQREADLLVIPWIIEYLK